MIYIRIHDGVDKDNKHKFKILDKNDKIVTDKVVLEYIKSLVIPPAYQNVKIFYEKNPKILFEGFDDKGRKQQIYSASHKKKAMTKKFCSLLGFGDVLSKIECDINKYISSPKLTKNKIISLILKIVMLCGFRIGNLKYQKLYNSFGISNIFTSHINKKGASIFIRFIGKKGVINECEVTDKILINEIEKLITGKKSDEYVFTYKDKNEETVITANEINNWLKSYHKDITSKMFRTWDTNLMFIEIMRTHEDPVKLTTTNRKKNVIEAMKKISNQINNTPTVCKSQYLHIDLWTMYIDEPKTYKKYFNTDVSAKTSFVGYLKDYCK